MLKWIKAKEITSRPKKNTNNVRVPTNTIQFNFTYTRKKNSSRFGLSVQDHTYVYKQYNTHVEQMNVWEQWTQTKRTKPIALHGKGSSLHNNSQIPSDSRGLFVLVFSSNHVQTLPSASVRKTVNCFVKHSARQNVWIFLDTWDKATKCFGTAKRMDEWKIRWMNTRPNHKLQWVISEDLMRSEIFCYWLVVAVVAVWLLQLPLMRSLLIHFGHSIFCISSEWVKLKGLQPKRRSKRANEVRTKHQFFFLDCSFARWMCVCVSRANETARECDKLWTTRGKNAKTTTTTKKHIDTLRL